MFHNQYCVLQTGCTPLHKAAYVGARDCLNTLLRHGGDLAAESSTNMSVMDIIFSHVPRPVHFLTDILNGSIIPNGASVNDRSFKVCLNWFLILTKFNFVSFEVYAAV